MKNNKHDRKEHKFGKLNRLQKYGTPEEQDAAWNEVKNLPFAEFVKYYNKRVGFLPWYCGGKDKGFDPHYDRHSRKQNRDIKRIEFEEE